MGAAILVLPLAISRWKKAFKMGLCRFADWAPMNRAVRTTGRPPPMRAWAFHLPDSPPPGGVGHHGAGNGRPDARDRGQQIFLITPQRRASYRVIDIIFDIAELAL